MGRSGCARALGVPAAGGAPSADALGETGRAARYSWPRPPAGLGAGPPALETRAGLRRWSGGVADHAPGIREPGCWVCPAPSQRAAAAPRRARPLTVRIPAGRLQTRRRGGGRGETLAPASEKCWGRCVPCAVGFSSADLSCLPGRRAPLCSLNQVTVLYALFMQRPFRYSF